MNESASNGSPDTTGMQQKTDSPSSPTVADRTRLIATCMEPNGRVLRGVQGTLMVLLNVPRSLSRKALV
jgi:hypothetical protein